MFSIVAAFAAILSLSLLHSTTDARLIQSFGNCAELNNYYVNKVVPLVGPYGLTSSNAYVNTRAPVGFDKVDPGRPGGPAGLPLYRPYRDPKLVEFSNVTAFDDEDGFGADSDAEEGKDFSGTNVQVKGVDEPDIIKTDGKRVYTLSGNVLSVVEVLADGKRGKRIGKIMLPSYPNDMLFEGDWIVTLSNGYTYRRPVYKRFVRDPSYGETSTIIHQVRVAKTGRPRVVSTLELEGRYVKAREVDGTARLVLQFNPLDSLWLYYPFRGVTQAQAKKWNREIVQYSRPGNWLPTYRLRKGKEVQTGAYARCGQIFHSPNTFAGFNLLTVVTFPLNGLLSPKAASSIMSNADKVYATKTSMYVTTSEFHFGDVDDSDARWGANYRTAIHKFALSDAGAAYTASGQITGSVINQFAMHEFNGVFFIATTDGASWWSNRDLTESKVTAFEPNVKTRVLRKIGEAGNLGVGERIYSVRYIRDMAYVVTFRETDPLYIIDLTNPRKLKVTGELKIPGFSTYLHPVAPGRILGVGQEATLSGRTTGAKVSLFDISDKSKPKELAIWTLRGAYSNAEWDHRAFLYWRRERVAVMPVSVYYGRNSFEGAIILDITDKTIKERGRIVQMRNGWPQSIRRNAIIGGVNLWSMSYDLLQINNVKNLKKQGQVVID